MKKIFLSILLFSYVLFLYGFTGFVKDTNGLPIKDVLVKSGFGYYFTDEIGRFYFSKTAKDDTLYFHKLGYKDKKIKMSKLPFTVILEVEPVNLKKVSISAKYNKEFEDDKIIINPHKTENLTSLLSEIEGLTIKGKSLSGEKRTVSIGGNLSKHTVVMLDGIVLNDTGEDFDISLIPADLIERIEIVKNNASSLVGSGAIGGVINFITKVGDNNSFKFKSALIIGSFSQKGFLQQISFNKNPNINLLIKSEYAKNNFKFIYPFSNDKPEYRRKNNFAKTETFDFNTSFKGLKIHFLIQNIKKGLPGTIDKIPMFDKSFLAAEKLKFFFNYQKIFNNNINLTFNLYNFYDKTNYDNTKSTLPLYFSKTETTENKIGVNAQQNFEFDKLSCGLKQEFKREQFNFKDIYSPQNSINLIKRDNFSLSNFTKKEFNFKDFKLLTQGNLRMDCSKTSQKSMEKFFSYRFTQSIGLSDEIKQKLIFHLGTSYSLPSFYDIYWKGDIQTQGNKDLKAEKSFGYGIDYKIEYLNFLANISYNDNKIKQLIYWYKSVLAWKPGNIANADIKNLNVLFSYDFYIISLKADYTRTIALDKTLSSDSLNSPYYNKNLTYIPDTKLLLQAKFNFENMYLKFNYEQIGKRWVTRDNLWGYLSPYSILNVSLGCNFFIISRYTLQADILVNNIFNTGYEVYQSMPGPGTNFEIKFTIKNTKKRRI